MTDLLKAALQALENLADEARGNGNSEEWIALQVAAIHAVLPLGHTLDFFNRAQPANP